jgi:hypothetical protein
MAAHLASPDAPCCHVGRVVIAGRPARDQGPVAAARPIGGEPFDRSQGPRRKVRHPEPWPLIVPSRKRILRATRSLAPVIAVCRGAGRGWWSQH